MVLNIDKFVNQIIQGDCLEVMKQIPDVAINCCITSPPYWRLRDYGVDGQLGLEKTPEEYVAKIVGVFSEVKRVLKDDGTLWLNLGDTYAGGGRGRSAPKQQSNKGTRDMPDSIIPAGLKPKDLVGIPWRVAFALQADGWWLRQDIIWQKPNLMPEPVTDRCTKSHEYVFLLAKSSKYYFDNEAIKEKAVWDITGIETGARIDRQLEGMKSSPTKIKNGIRYRQFGATKQEGTKRHDIGNMFEDTGYRNKRSVWTVNTHPCKNAHFATFPEKLIEPMIFAGCPVDGIVLDPFVGSGTTCKVAKRLGRRYIGIELNEKYIKDIANRRLAQGVLC